MADAQTPDVETRARSLGWVPQEEFRGDATRWVDAETFVKRGEEVMPLLKANNQRLQTEIEGLRGQLSEAQQAIKESQEAMQELITHQSETTLQAVKDTKARLRTQIRAAREAQDWEALDELEEQLDTVRDTERDLETKKPPVKTTAAPPPPAPPKPDPEFVAWQAANPWFGSDKRRTALMVTEAHEMRQVEKTALTGRAFYEEAASRVDAFLSPRSKTPKVDGGTGSGTPTARTEGDTKTYASLPSDAKAACDKLSKTLVGPNRAFKDKEAWQKHYAEQYYLYE